MNNELVGIFNNDTFEQLFLNATLISVSVNDTSKVMSHPLEDGSQTSDHQVFDLIKIGIAVVLGSDDFVAVFQNIDKGYKSSTLYTIQTKVNTYKDMLIDAKPHEETVNSGIRLALSFTQFTKEKAKIGISPKRKSDSNTTKRGVQNSNETETEKTKRTTFLKGLYS